MNIVAILQARSGSTRLPKKVFLPLAGKPMVTNIVERVQRANGVDHVVAAIPWGDSMPEMPCEIMAPTVPEDDLIGRYLHVAEQTRADLIVRIPCDNPCVDPFFVDRAIETYLRFPFVYYSNTTACCHELQCDGIGAEVFSYTRLQWLEQRTAGVPHWREHPHQYFVEQGLLDLPRADVRLDVNTRADYDFIRDIYEHFGHNQFSTPEIITYLQTKEAHHATV